MRLLLGGNDSKHMIVPIDSRYAAYQQMRVRCASVSGVLLPAGGSGYPCIPQSVNVQKRIYIRNVRT